MFFSFYSGLVLLLVLASCCPTGAVFPIEVVEILIDNAAQQKDYLAKTLEFKRDLLRQKVTLG